MITISVLIAAIILSLILALPLIFNDSCNPAPNMAGILLILFALLCFGVAVTKLDVWEKARTEVAKQQ